jgi:tRNA modification GTPase
MSSTENQDSNQFNAFMSGSYELTDTIVAISTNNHLDAPIGIVRLSGSKAFEFVEKISDLKTDNLEHAHLKLTNLYSIKNSVLSVSEKNIPKNDRTLIDEAMIVGFHNPKSYTGEDLIEFHCHGNRGILIELCDELISLGARPASAGEFSYRAVINGKMEITQAESVQELISSGNPQFRKSAQFALHGKLQKELSILRDKLLSCRSFIELDIDFMEQGYSGEGLAAALPYVADVKSELENMITRSERLRKRKSSISVSLIGIPNAGKSKLFNSLLSENRAIVSEEKGTTRDTISETVQIGSFMVNLSDTAGLREAENKIEKEGVERTLEALRSSDLSVLVFDPENFNESVVSFESIPENLREKIIAVIGKSDLINEDTLENLSSRLPFQKIIPVSGKDNLGLDDLVSEITSRLENSESESSELNLLISERQIGLVKEAYKKFLNFESEAKRFSDPNSSDHGLSSDLLSVHLNDAQATLEKVLGKISPDEMVNHIFSNFCIGK